MDPLVSVTIPTYNSASTLPLALASVIAQTYQNWECIVVDDGSTDDTAELMEAVQGLDSRFRYIRLPENRGRAVARQTALDNAAGDYLAMVDADDWIYPEKLERQVEVLKEYSELALVSSGMAIVDSEQRLLGLRNIHSETLVIFHPLRDPRFPPIPHAPSMIRSGIARAAGYDQRFRRTEDADFLLRILMHRPFGTLGHPLYAYAEHQSLDWRAISIARLSGMRMLGKYLREFPLTVAQNLGATIGKLFVTILIGILGQDRLHAKFRPLEVPSSAQVRDFNSAWMRVSGRVHELTRQISESPSVQ